MAVCIQPDAGSDAIAHELSDPGADARSDAVSHAEVRRSIGCDASLLHVNGPTFAPALAHICTGTRPTVALVLGHFA